MSTTCVNKIGSQIRAYFLKKLRTEKHVEVDLGYTIHTTILIQHQSLLLFVTHLNTNCRQVFKWWICVVVSRRFNTRCLFFKKLALYISTWICVQYWFPMFMVDSAYNWIRVFFGQICALSLLHFCHNFWMMYYFQSICMNVSIGCNYVVFWCSKDIVKITIKV